MKPKTVYLDYAAATPLDPRVAAAMAPFGTAEFANPSALYELSRAPRQALDNARRDIAELLGAKPGEVILTAGATESVNLAIQGVLRAHPGAALVTAAAEHSAVLATARALAEEGYGLSLVQPARDGAVRAADVAAAVTDQTVLVSLAYAWSETGIIQPLAAVGKAIAKIRADRQQRGVELPLYLHTDATAVAGWLDLHVDRLHVDLMTINGSKIYGPKQSGCLYVRTGTRLRPLIFGGGQEGGRRSGTQNPAIAVGLALALRLADECRRAGEGRRLQDLRQRLDRAILAAISDSHLVGVATERLPYISCFWFDGIDGEDLVLHLDREGIAVGTGAACAAGDTRPSEGLLALGLDGAAAQSSIRVSLGRQTTEIDVQRLIDVLPGVVERLRQHAGGVQ